MQHEDCAICLEKLTGTIAILDCNHPYHFPCLQSWYKKRIKHNKGLNCPLCNTDSADVLNVIEIPCSKPPRPPYPKPKPTYRLETIPNPNQTTFCTIL